MSETTGVKPNNDGSGGQERLPHRRTIIKGAAWSLPAIAVAVAAPAQAASACTQVGQLIETRATTANWVSARPEVAVTVPAGVTRMHFVVVGGGGAGVGGYAAHLEGDLAVVAGSTFYLQAGAGGEDGGSSTRGRGGKSLYGNGGDGGHSTWSSDSYYGPGGGGASALLDSSRNEIAVAGGGGGGNINTVPYGPNEPLYSSSLVHDQTATYGGSSVTARGGSADAGLPGTRGETGPLGWMGRRPSSSTEPTSTQIVLMSGGGIGGGPVENDGGAGGQPVWVSGPNFSNYWSRPGAAGSGHNGGAGGGAGGGEAGGGSGGGAGGYSGGGGGAAVATRWNEPPYPYDGNYGIAGGGGGGSSFLRADVTNRNTTHAPNGDIHGEMGYVRVTFFTC